ncbi:anti-sigma-factor antagonist [Candidatus Magnetomorum sp. HK-1]|nr:anti-sigma-factor antagonist [Candidatus Magnetomorum sp. HK-1]
MSKKTVKPGKDIVASMVSDLKKELQNMIIEDGVTDLEIDLTGVEMVDSVGLGAFIATHNTLTQKNGKLTVTNASEDIFSLFRTMRLDQHFEIHQG